MNGVYCDYANKIVYLNNQNRIIDTVDLSEGTVNASSVSPREVIEGTIKFNATSLIFVHNHSSGNPEPSSSDKALTRELVFVSRVMRIKVLDHIIIGDNKYFSFAGEGLIEEYETDFMNMMLRGTAEAKRRIYRAKLSSDKSHQ